jgi:hypothetical protein
VQKSSASRAPVDPKTRLQRLEERYRHELMGEEECLELYERIVRLRRKLDLTEPEMMRLASAYALERRTS